MQLGGQPKPIARIPAIFFFSVVPANVIII